MRAKRVHDNGDGDGARRGFSYISSGDVALSARGLILCTAPAARRGLLGSPIGLPMMVRGGRGNWMDDASRGGLPSGGPSGKTFARWGLAAVLLVAKVPFDPSFLWVRSAKRGQLNGIRGHKNHHSRPMNEVISYSVPSESTRILPVGSGSSLSEKGTEMFLACSATTGILGGSSSTSTACDL